MLIELFGLIIHILFVLATGFLFLIVFKSYLRFRNSKLALITVGFAIFFMHALAYLPEVFVEEYRLVLSSNTHLVIHLTALIFIAAGMLKD